jgi:hypothetical protein
VIPGRDAGRIHRAEAGSFTPRFLPHLLRNRSRGGSKRHPTSRAARPRKSLLRKRVVRAVRVRLIGQTVNSLGALGPAFEG